MKTLRHSFSIQRHHVFFTKDDDFIFVLSEILSIAEISENEHGQILFWFEFKVVFLQWRMVGNNKIYEILLDEDLLRIYFEWLSE